MCRVFNDAEPGGQLIRTAMENRCKLLLRHSQYAANGPHALTERYVLTVEAHLALNVRPSLPAPAFKE